MPSGIRDCWMLWRHCCCRYGFYPAAVAPIATAGFILSAYSSAGCQFMDLQIGFTPSNAAWNSSHTEIGLFYHYNPHAQENDNVYQHFFNHHCVSYTSAFDNTFIQHDRTWKIARIMAMVALGSGGLAAVMAWLMVMAPVPTDCLWSGLLLPSIMVAFISEGSKFLFFDNAMCRSSIWFPSGINSPPTSAESCTLGPSAMYAIAAGVVNLIVVFMVCLSAPEERDLDPDFGVLYTTGAEMDLEAAKDSSQPNHFDGAAPTILTQTANNSQDLCDSSNYEHDSVSGVFTTENASTAAGDSSQHQSSASSSTSPSVKATNATTKMTTTTLITTLPLSDVSASRLTAMSKAERSANERLSPDKLLADLVSDLDKSFQAGGIPR